MHFDLVDLRLFMRIAEAGSITGGAAAANLALASASARIAAMEADLGTRLLQRGRRGINLTPAGQALAHHAQIVLQQVAQLRGELAGYGKGLRGRVRVLANTSAGAEFLPQALGDFLAAHRGIDVDLEERASFDIVRAVAEGYAELGLVADIVDFAGLEVFPFATDRLVLVTAAGHRLARQRAVAFRTLLDEPMVGLAPGNALQQHLGQHALQAGRPLQLRVRLGSVDAVCAMVAQGIGVAVVPETAARRCARQLALRIVLLSDAWSVRQLHVCVRDAVQLPRPAQLLLRHLRGWAESAPASRRRRSRAG